jgi:CDP-diacylglycerol--glycerol-3-phosphate 3-phosphatidyltransferase
MGVYAIKPRFRSALRGIEATLIARGVTADQLTGGGLAAALAMAGAVVATAQVSLLWLAVPALAVARLACNALDGMVASSTGSARPLGQVFNETADRVADAAVLLAITERSNHVLLGAACIAAVLCTSYLGTVAAAAGGTRQYGGVMGKADRMLLIAAAAPLALLLPTAAVLRSVLAVITAGVTVTFVQRCSAIRRDLSTTRTR